MSKHVLIADPSSILSSQLIQIIHKHPDFSHRVRSDLDPYEVIASSYPIALANKIIPFLESSPSTCTAAPTARLRSRTRSPKRQRTASPPKRERRTTSTNSDFDYQNDSKSISPHRASPRKTSPSQKDTTTTTSSTQTLASLPTPHLTPVRQLDPPIQFTPGTVDTAYTPRTISPNGTFFSPLKPLTDTWPPTLPTSSQNSITSTSSIPPSALFTPAKPSRTTRSAATATPDPLSPPPTTAQKSNRPRNPPQVISYNPKPTSLDGSPPLPTLCLRHDLPTENLRDVLEWCLVSVQLRRVPDLDGWMVRFRNTARVRGIIEVCRGLRLERMERVAEGVLERLEGGFGAGWEGE